MSQNIAALLRHIRGEPPYAILDLGCGPGRDLAALRAMGHEPVGLEGAPALAAMAREHSGCEVWEQDFLALDLPEARFDGIFANASLFHVPQKELPRVLGELRAALKPGGVLFSSNPRGNNEEGWNRGRYGVWHDLESWRRYLTAAGFTELEHYYRPTGLPREQQPWLASVWRRNEDEGETMSTPVAERVDIEALAAEMKAAQDHARQVPPFTARIRGFDVAAAYEVSRAIHRRRVAEGAKPLGRKIGFTNPEVQALYGVHQPMWAHVYDTTTRLLEGLQAECEPARYAQPLLEPEIVLHFARAPSANADAEEILACLDWVAHGFEIVQSNFPDWRFQAADTVADSGLHAALFVGPPVAIGALGADPATVLRTFTLELFRNGARVDAGRGANVLGSPLLAAAHLVATLAGQPASEPLQAGEIVTTGTITDAHAVTAGETWETRLEGIALPNLSIRFR